MTKMIPDANCNRAAAALLVRSHAGPRRPQMPVNDEADMAAAPDVLAFVRASGLAADDGQVSMSPLTGGVASDIWRVDAGGRTFVVKKALARLRVAREWIAPVSRNAAEVEWMLEAGRIVPGSVPVILAHDAGIGAYAMEFLDPADHPVWKAQLHAGQVDMAFAARLGRIMAGIHAATAGRPEIAKRFDNDATFHSIRLEPYFEATSAAHPDLTARLFQLSRDTLARKLALVHGDISPKNILAGPDGPVILDAECAWYGDPAFDLAFCLNHLLLKCLWTPSSRSSFLQCFDVLAASYFEHAGWEPRTDLEARVAALLPALLLARVDGKSPVEYVTAAADKDRIRRVARPLVSNPPQALSVMRDAWAKEISA
jgi:aminoglycoside phosphotransferase (APT) family kinase protein